ncbi:hypothetical protein BDW42DRAFT_194356 [Aspergillus taichungensis]|uniref:Uncharacterized protein n=1 Tax=Aspergillus taichungensis TaxID=482145 RepID=A0A2J5HT57_9EURO|nr:hypothetical protein BDW42DRAFT_194356 [Aspergillus taichungensis]
MKRRRSSLSDDDLKTPPSSAGTETADDTPSQGVDGSTSKAAPDEIDSLVLQWTTVGGDEMVSALRVD